MTSTVSALARRFGITRAVAYSVLVRVWSVAAGPVSLMFIARFLSKEEQGFYYTIWSVLGLQIVFELGFSFIIAQFASHERARLSLVEGRMRGDERAHGRLASLLRLSVRWYAAAGAIMVVVLLPAGLLFFLKYSHETDVSWMGPWVLVAIVTAGNLTLIPFTALLEGAGQIEDVSRMRLFQLITTNTLVWCSLAAGARLYAAVILGGTMFGFAVTWLTIRHRRLFADLWRVGAIADPIRWRTEVWPFQWRMAVSWVSSYLVFQLFNPLLFASQGAVAAARMGMSLMVVIAISQFAVAWVNARAVDYGALIAARRFEELDTIFRYSLWQSTGAMAFISFGFIATVAVLRAIHHPLADRLLPMRPLLMLIAGAILSHIVVAEAAYLRAFKREPFMWLTLMTALLTMGGSLIVAKQYGADGIAAVFLAVAATVGVGGGTLIFLRARRAWREEPIASAEALFPDVPSIGDSPTG